MLPAYWQELVMAAIGFRPTRLINGALWNGAVTRCSLLASYATGIFVGDSVIMVGTSSTSPIDGAILNDVQACAATNRTFGVVTAVIPTVGTPNLQIIYGAASTYREVWVATAEPNLVFEATVNAAVLVSGASAIQGTMYQLSAGAGSTTTGLSAHVLDNGTTSTTTQAWMVIGVRNDPGNLATVGSVTANTSVISTASNPTIFEVICTQPQVYITQVGAGV
jgi:hypothetical protein